MPPHFWRAVIGALTALAAYAGLVKHDGTLCHDVFRTCFRTDTLAGRVVFTGLLVLFWLHIIRWPADRPRPGKRR